jgi:hypothetical protein
MAAPLERTDVPGVYRRGSRYVYSYRYRGGRRGKGGRRRCRRVASPGRSPRAVSRREPFQAAAVAS